MHLPPPPDARELLPPLLACLPTSFVAPRPPPALLPLLSPLLRQRVNFLSTSNASRSDGWLPLLAWDSQGAARLAPVVERMQLEPHPVSGEIELDEVRPAKYRRLDEETLHSRLDVEQFELLPIYVWCENDEHGGTGAGWRLAELRTLEEEEDDDETGWYDSISEATNAPLQPASIPELRANGTQQAQETDDNDDDYWAAYDRTPGRTPAQKHSPAPASLTAGAAGAPRRRSQSELDYYARYGEVQPAMDSHDPDEEHPDLGASTLNGSALLSNLQQPSQGQQPRSIATEDRPLSRPNGSSLFPADPAPTAQRTVEAPRPISPASSHGSSSVERLEERAAAMSEAPAPDRAQLAIQQHISTDIKSLFRLAKSAGMERREFERVVRRELEVLQLLEQDD